MIDYVIQKIVSTKSVEMIMFRLAKKKSPIHFLTYVKTIYSMTFYQAFNQSRRNTKKSSIIKQIKVNAQ